ncbi:MAG: sigma 54-interacting transcriptional regulator [Myxococcota bacterium]
MSDERTTPYRRSGDPIRGLRVEVLEGPDRGQTQEASSETLTIGSAPGNDLVLTDTTVSRYHVELRRDGDRILVEDHSSTNGTVAGGVTIQRATIAPGTVLTLGRTQIRVADGHIVDLEAIDEDNLGPLRGRAPEMRTLMARIRRVAQAGASVLVLGETGSGKELIARALHEESPRKDAPFETVDCGTLMPTLVASELFGHEKGAFTGAERQHIGAFERASGGTIFLDEIGELPRDLQATLLGVLERRVMRRVGGSKTIPVDVRVVAATHRDLRAEVNAGTFRQDLYYRLGVVLLRVPPLRARPGDIPLLVEHFLRDAGYNGNVDDLIPPEAMATLKTYHWPGNVRELRNFVESAMALGETPNLEQSSESAAAPSASSGFPSVSLETLYKRAYKDARAFVLSEFERLYLSALLERTAGNVSRAARESDINRTHLIQMLKRHPVDRHRGP